MRNVPDGESLLVSNKIHIPKEAGLEKSKIKNVIRQRVNHRTIFIRLKLRVYNAVDSTKAEDSRKRRLVHYKKRNKKLLDKQIRINEKRINKSLKRGDSLFDPKIVEFKDTINPRPTIKERLKYKYGEEPVVFDTSLMKTSASQIHLFMQKSGFFNAEVSTEVEIDTSKWKARVHYYITPNKEYIVDSMYLVNNNGVPAAVYRKFILESKDAMVTPFRFNSKKLGDMRKSLTEYMKDQGLYGFKENYITFEVDTLDRSDNIKIAVNISDRIVGEGADERTKPFVSTNINRVTFHLLDSMAYKGNFRAKVLEITGKDLKPYADLPTYDTLRYDWYKGRHKEFRTATFLYNGKLTTRAALIEFQNYLEETNSYKGKYLTQSYNRMMNLDIFSSVKIKTTEISDGVINVDYFLTPKKPQTFSFEPKGTHNNSFLGVSASVNYINRNLFHWGHRLKVTFSGGFESQPEVFGKNDENTVLNDGTHSFNTLEFGPSIEYDIPGLVPLRIRRLTKSQNPVTTFSAGYNFQQRTEFKRQIFQLSYLWKFSDIFHTQVFTVGIPVIGGIQFVKIDKTEAFKNRLEEQNDLFLINAYSNQAIYKDAAVTYIFTNPDLKDGDITFSYGFNFDLAGMVMSLITNKDPVNEKGYKEFLGQRYSQFIRLDNQFILHQKIDDDNSLHYRLQLGAGVPLKNNGLTLPFDYSFFGGGSNDNRGFRARTLGPGAYKYYLDTSRTITEMGDMRMGASFEYRYKITKLFEIGLFTDAGNIWTYNNDPNREGGQISKDFLKQLSVSGGVGLRLDFTFLIVRLDVGLPLRNPSLPKNARWIFQSRAPYYQEGIDEWGINSATGDYFYKEFLPKPFKPQFHIAIGYPF